MTYILAPGDILRIEYILRPLPHTFMAFGGRGGFLGGVSLGPYVTPSGPQPTLRTWRDRRAMGLAFTKIWQRLTLQPQATKNLRRVGPGVFFFFFFSNPAGVSVCVLRFCFLWGTIAYLPFPLIPAWCSVLLGCCFPVLLMACLFHVVAECHRQNPVDLGGCPYFSSTRLVTLQGSKLAPTSELTPLKERINGQTGNR